MRDAHRAGAARNGAQRITQTGTGTDKAGLDCYAPAKTARISRSSLMDEASTKPDVIRFAEFELDLRSSQLRSRGVVVKLQPQPVRVLALLIENAGVLIS